MCNKMQTVAPVVGQTGLEKVEIQPKSKLSFLIGQACLADELIALSSRGTSQYDLIKLRLATKDLDSTISRLLIFYVNFLMYFYHLRYWLVVGWKSKLSIAESHG